MSATRGGPPVSAPRTGGGALGLGLMVAGGALGLLIVLWLLVNVAGGQLRAGGAVLGLFFVLILALPLIGVGWYLRSREPAELAAAATLTERRAVLDQDAVLRRELARELEQRAGGLLTAGDSLPAAGRSTLVAAAQRLRDLRQDLERPGYDASTLLDAAAGLDDRQAATVRRYDTLVLEEARQLAQLTRELGTDGAQGVEGVDRAVSQLEDHVREREALLGRGQRAAAMSPQEMLAVGARPRRTPARPLELGLGDAASYEGADYLVRAVLIYFAGGRNWRAYQLHDGKQERWLEVRAEGADLAWLVPLAAPPAATAGAVTLDGETWRETENGSASVGIESAAGTQEGVFVEYRRYAGMGDERLLVERWPDGPRALRGGPVAAEDLQLWTKPASAE